MKLSLVVTTPGKGEGKVVPIAVPTFVIGRDPTCQLRPASAMISKRHCALQVRGPKVFAQDFGSTNGTFVNDQPVKGEVELHDKDRLKVGPLAFEVRIEVPAQAAKPPAPKSESKPAAKTPPKAASQDDDDAAAMLLSGDDGSPTPATEGSATLGTDEIPTGSTIYETAAIQMPEDKDKGDKPPDKKPEPAKKPPEDSSKAAQAILEKYMRRSR